jgi:hypothetical protein
MRLCLIQVGKDLLANRQRERFDRRELIARQIVESRGDGFGNHWAAVE